MKFTTSSRKNNETYERTKNTIPPRTPPSHYYHYEYSTPEYSGDEMIMKQLWRRFSKNPMSDVYINGWMHLKGKSDIDGALGIDHLRWLLDAIRTNPQDNINAYDICIKICAQLLK